MFALPSLIRKIEKPQLKLSEKKVASTQLE